MRCSHLGEPFSKDAPWTTRLITIELANVQMQDNLHVLKREIPDRAFIAAMDTVSQRSTYRAEGGRSDPFTDEDQTPSLPVRGAQAEPVEVWKENR
jgi:hypothetical protein